MIETQCIEHVSILYYNMVILKYVYYLFQHQMPQFCFCVFLSSACFCFICLTLPDSPEALSLLAWGSLGVCPVSIPSYFWPFGFRIQVNQVDWSCMYDMGFPGGSLVKNPPANAVDAGSTPGSGRSPGEGNCNPLQFSCLGKCTDRGAWWAAVHGVTKSPDTTWRLSTSMYNVNECILPRGFPFSE